MANQKLTALSEISVPELEDLLYIVEDPGATPTSRKVTAARLLGLVMRYTCDGRLSLATGVPVHTSDQTGKTTIYFTPYNGELISLYDGTRWKLYTFSEKSLALGTLTSGGIYDVFIYDNAGTLTLEFSAAWTNATTRSEALTFQDGVLVKSGATTKRYVGSFKTTSTTATEESAVKSFVWNMYNRVDRHMFKSDATDAWTATVNGYRQARADATNQIEVIVGWAGDSIEVQINGTGNSSSGLANVAIGYDSTTTPHADCVFNRSGATSIRIPCSASLHHQTGLGYHTYTWLEGSNNNSASWLGTDSSKCGITALFKS